jgi:pSer/pThr/pTyr-binding forkhead associated (FHA) protein
VHLDHGALNRRHAELELRGASFWVRDLGSQNGTFVGDTRVTDAHALVGGEEIVMGRYTLRIERRADESRDPPVVTVSGPDGTQHHPMSDDEIFIGRPPDCDIVIDHETIARRHLRIAVASDHFVAEDLVTQSGTRVRHRRIDGPTPFRLGGHDDEPTAARFASGAEHTRLSKCFCGRAHLSSSAWTRAHARQAFPRRRTGTPVGDGVVCRARKCWPNA